MHGTRPSPELAKEFYVVHRLEVVSPSDLFGVLRMRATLFSNCLFFLITISFTVSCAKDPSKDAPKAQVGPAKTAEAAAKPNEAPVTPQTETPEKTPATKANSQLIKLSGTLGFKGSKVTGSHTGVFKTWTGTVEMGDSLENSQLKLSADVASVFTDPENRGAFSEKLDGHLKSADFFDAGKHPKATFTSKAITPKAENDNTHLITGDLSMRGVTREITFPAKVALSDSQVSGKAEFTISRSQWGIVYKGKANDLIRDGVVLTIDVIGKR